MMMIMMMKMFMFDECVGGCRGRLLIDIFDHTHCTCIMQCLHCRCNILGSFAALSLLCLHGDPSPLKVCSLSGMVFNWKQIRGKQFLVHSTQKHVRTDILKVPKNWHWGNFLGRVKEVAPFDAFIIEIWTVYCYVITHSCQVEHAQFI